jgi:hypothetical protein
MHGIFDFNLVEHTFLKQKKFGLSKHVLASESTVPLQVISGVVLGNPGNWHTLSVQFPEKQASSIEQGCDSKLLKRHRLTVKLQ